MGFIYECIVLTAKVSIGTVVLVGIALSALLATGIIMTLLEGQND